MVAALDLYFRLTAIRIRAQMQYRVPFLLELFTTAFMGFTAFVTIYLTLQRFEGIGGWSLWEVAFLYGTVELSFGAMDMLFSGFDPQFFGNQVRTGAFDQMLLRPANITVQVLGSEFVMRRLGRVFQGGAVLALALSHLQIDWTVGKALYLPVILLSLICFFGGLFVVGAAITFWTVDSIEVVNILTYGGTEMYAYPMNIYPAWLRGFFTYVLPGIFLNYYPALYLLGKPDPLGMPAFAPFLAPVAGAGVLAAGLAFWGFALRHYQSTGT